VDECKPLVVGLIFENCVGRDVSYVMSHRVPHHGRMTPLQVGQCTFKPIGTRAESSAGISA